MTGVAAASREAQLRGRGCCICYFFLSGGHRATMPPPTKQYRKDCMCMRVTQGSKGARSTALPDAEQPSLKGEGLPRRWVIRGVQAPLATQSTQLHSSHGVSSAQRLTAQHQWFPEPGLVFVLSRKRICPCPVSPFTWQG